MKYRFLLTLCACLILSAPLSHAGDACISSAWKQPNNPEAETQFEKGASAFSAGDFAAAFAAWKPLANQGNCMAQFNLGALYLRGRGTPIDENTAFMWFRKAAEQGHATAQFNLGEAYRMGITVPKDQKLADSWYEKAAEQGLSQAQYFIGIAYQLGDGVERDLDKAFQYYRKAAAQGNADAQYNAGVMYALGQGVPGDRVLAYFYVSVAAKSGSELAKKGVPAIAARISAEQLDEAQQLIASWKPSAPFPESSLTGKTN